MHADFPFVAAPHIEATVKRGLIWERVTSWLTLLATIGVGWYWWGEFSSTMPWLGLCLFVTFFLIPLAANMPAGIPLEKASAELLGKYTKDDLERIVREVCATYKEREIPKVYVLDSKEGIAMVMNVDGLDFIRPWNALYLGQYLLHSLEERELKAILAHEMCHFSMHYTLGSRFFYLRMVAFAVWMTTLLSFPLRWWEGFIGDGWMFWLGIVVLFFFGVATFALNLALIISGLVVRFSDRSDSHEVEALCDLEAARRFGMTPMVNALLKLSSRQEIFVAVMTALSPDSKRPIGWGNLENSMGGGISEEKLELQGNAIKAAIEKLEEVLPPNFLSLEQANPYVEEAVQAGIESSGGQRFRHRVKHVLQWLKYDTRIRDKQLDSKELMHLLEDLKRHPDSPLLNLPEEIDPELARQAEHPNISDRILFLAHNLQGRDAG